MYAVKGSPVLQSPLHVPINSTHKQVTAELSDLKAQQRQYIAEREEELEVHIV